MPVSHGRMQDYCLTLDKFLTHAAKWHPDAEVVTARDGEPGRVSYSGLERRSRKTSSVLASLGAGPGDHVATLAWNTQAHLEVWYAVMGMGAVCHTLNPRLAPDQLGEMLARSDARVLVTSADLLDLAGRVAERSAVRPRILVIDGAGASNCVGGPPVQALEPLVADAPEDAVWGGFPETAPAGLCFTSGTTGAPKGVTYTHRSNYLHTLRLLQADVLGITSRDAVLVAVPMFHANAWGLPFAIPCAGAKMILPGRHLDGPQLAELINAEGATVAVGVATVWLGLVEHLEAQDARTPTLQRVVVGGAPLAPALMNRIETVLGVTVQTSWGMTELSPSGTFAAPDDPARSPRRSGRPALGVDLLLTDETGLPLPEQRGPEGHLKVRGPAVARRYFGESEDATDAEGWFPTGDLARIGADGELTITGRAKDLIKSGGEWINPAQIEAIVSEQPGVSLVAVIGREDPKWGERPVLVVQTGESAHTGDEDLLAPLRGRVPSWWIPDAVVRLDQMPLAPTGKIDKMRLRTEHG